MDRVNSSELNKHGTKFLKDLLLSPVQFHPLFSSIIKEGKSSVSGEKTGNRRAKVSEVISMDS